MNWVCRPIHWPSHQFPLMRLCVWVCAWEHDWNRSTTNQDWWNMFARGLATWHIGAPAERMQSINDTNSDAVPKEQLIRLQKIHLATIHNGRVVNINQDHHNQQQGPPTSQRLVIFRSIAQNVQGLWAFKTVMVNWNELKSSWTWKV